MKKFTLFLLSLIPFLGISAQQTTVKPLFHDYMTGTRPSEASDIAIANDGSVYSLVNFQTNALSGQGFTLNGDTIGINPEVVGKTTNYNLALVKTDASGNKLWSLQTVSGNVAFRVTPTPGALVGATADGGCILIAKIEHAQNQGDKNIAFIDGTGSRYELNWKLDSAKADRYFNIAILKVSADGKIEWNKLINVNHDPQPNPGKNYTKVTPDGFSLGDIAISKDGDIYFGGRYAKAFTLTKADSSSVTLTPTNVSEKWDGGAYGGIVISTSYVGNPFLIHLDSNGNYLGSITTEGTAKVGTITSLAFGSDGDLYATGTMIGVDSTVTIGPKTFRPSKEQGLFAARLSKDLKFKWFSYLNGAKNSTVFSVIAVSKLRPINNNVWLYGQIRGKLYTENGDSVTSYDKYPPKNAQFVEGYLIKLNANDGSYEGNAMSNNDSIPDRLHTYGLVYANPADTSSIYVVDNWGMIQKVETGFKGPYVIRYDVNTLKQKGKVNLYSGGTAMTQVGLQEVGDSVYSLATVTGQIDFNDNTSVGAAKQRGVLFTALEVPFADAATGIKSITSDGNVARKADNAMYNLAGQRVDASYRGIVIMNGKKFVRR